MPAVAARLKGMPEFMDALHKAYFGTNPADIDRSIGRVTVKFQKGDCIYAITCVTERSPSVSDRPSPHISKMLSIIKSSVASPKNRLYADLTAEFDEAHGEISEFTSGTARVQDTNFVVYEGAGALEKMPEILTDLLPPKKL